MTVTVEDIKSHCSTVIQRCDLIISILEGVHGRELWDEEKYLMSDTDKVVVCLAMKETMLDVLELLNRVKTGDLDEN